MDKSESIGELAKALAVVQGSIDDVFKGSSGHGYNYADLSSVLTTARPILSANGLSISQFPASSEREGCIAIESILMHSSGEWISQSYSMPIPDNKRNSAAQNAGSAITYARRYALAAIVGIAQTDDDAVGAKAENDKQEAHNKEQLLMAINFNQKSIDAIKAGITSGELSTAAEAWFELDDNTKQWLWVAPSKGGPFTTIERRVMESTEFRTSHFGEQP